ncbi:MAG: hypothetical protein D6748_09595 [Calditrichaeota bacterium]|nr:MAG: hypothetical protein D6748_09595 [Calditrichota bacterium]
MSDKTNLIIYWKTILLFLLIFLTWNCTERHRTNPFDPKGEVEQVIDLHLTPQSDSIHLEWELTRPLEGFIGFRLYRSEGSPDEMRPYKVFSANQFSFTDTLIEQGEWYYYRMTILGKNGIESVPSPVRKALTGPGKAWILSKYDERVYQISYDLQHVARFFPIYTRPESWEIEAQDSLIWICFNLYDNGVIRLNRHNGNLQYYYLDELQHAQDIAIDRRTNKIYILDSEIPAIFIFNGQTIIDTLTLPADVHFMNVQFIPGESKLFLAGDRQALLMPLAPNGPGNTPIPYPPSFEAQDSEVIGDRIYLLVYSEEQQESHIYTYTTDGTLLDSLIYQGHLYKLATDWVDEHYYVAETQNGFEDFLLQLSFGGVRQFQVGGFRVITDIHINPFDRSVVVADGFTDNLVLINPQGTVLSQSHQSDEQLNIEGPIGVYIEP